MCIRDRRYCTIKLTIPRSVPNVKQSGKESSPVFHILFADCSKLPQRNSIFILYNKGAVREEQKNILPRCHAGNENRASPAETGRRGPFKKHCPLLMRGNSQGSGQTTNHLLTAANVWEFSYTASAAFSSFPRRWLFLFGYGLNLSVSLRSPAPLVGEPLAFRCVCIVTQ